MFCASDIGWVVGHSYILYAPLLVGATTVLFEGKPVGTPDAGTFWRVVAEHKANVLFTAPTALRAIRKGDPDNKQFEKIAGNGNLRHLRALFLAGERSEPSIVRAYQDLLDKHAAPGALVVDNWWSSESGSPISGLALRSAAGHVPPRPNESQIAPLPIRPGSAGLPAPGFDVRVVDETATKCARAQWATS
jgi:propionyl-CoA synthetase